ncbi:Riboflavin biosynthesis protein RibBA [Streptomyces microflavus]
MTAQPTWLHPGHDPLAEDLSLDPVEQAIRDIAAGRPVVVVDDEDRENEGDLVIAAEMATPEIVAFMMSECRGLICAPMESDELERLELPQMVEDNTESMQTAFTVSVDASAAHGVTTGISSADRATTLRMLAGGTAGPGDFVRPGHIFPLRARSGGVLVRNGHTEAAVDLARLAGLRPAGAIVEIAGEDGTMLRLPELVPFARKHGLTIISIEDLIAYRRSAEPTVRREAATRLPTAFGDFTAYGYRSTVDGVEHVALVHGDVTEGGGEDILVRIHSECLTGDIFQSQRCDCGPQLHASMQRITEEGRGVVVYLRGHEGRGIGLLSKLRAYELQERGRGHPRRQPGARPARRRPRLRGGRPDPQGPRRTQPATDDQQPRQDRGGPAPRARRHRPGADARAGRRAQSAVPAHQARPHGPRPSLAGRRPGVALRQPVTTDHFYATSFRRTMSGKGAR